MQVRILVDRPGNLMEQVWPPIGTEIELPEGLAVSLLNDGLAEPVTVAPVETATAPAAQDAAVIPAETAEAPAAETAAQ